MLGRVFLGIRVTAKNGSSHSLSYLYWGWIRHVANEEHVSLPESGTATDSLSENDAKKLASCLRARADKIRKGLAPRDATAYVRQFDKGWFPAVEKEDVKISTVDFDEPEQIEEIARFFESSGGVTLDY